MLELNGESKEEFSIAIRELDKAGYKDVIELPVIQKLKGISFLGILDHIHQIPNPPTRFEHTISVAYYTLALAKHINLNESDTTVLIIAALLHDCGHAPFSHNSEPFLLETKRLYHTGVLSKILFSSRIHETEFSLENKLKSLYDSEIIDKVILLLDGKLDSFLLSLFQSPLSCDKIEGNHRTGKQLGFRGIDPLNILDIFKLDKNQIFINSISLDLISSFWNHEKTLYWKYIYTDAVFAAEAMLTRCLSLRFGNPSNDFFNLNDREAILAIRDLDVGRTLIDKIEAGNYLSPLSKIDKNEFHVFENAFKEIRFDFKKRRLLELEIARKFNIEHELVISHFSRRKHFNGDVHVLKQLNLFTGSESEIPLVKINEALKRTKVSGDYFEIFLAI